MTTDARQENLRMVGTILGASAAVIAAFAVAALLGWMPLSVPASRAAAVVFATTASLEALLAAFFLVRYRKS